jgi:triosephosphate isomerase
MFEPPKVWIGTSWKMNKTLVEARQFARKLMAVNSDAQIQRFVIPPFTCARQVKSDLFGTNVMVGAQNMHWASEGAWTGEISAPMLNDCKLDLVELGHSERREHFAETDYTVGLKVESALRHNLIPLICIGETLEERKAGIASEVLARQVTGALDMIVSNKNIPKLLFAYEPVWAIGDKGIPATSDYANKRQAEIIEVAQKILNVRVPCLYGGSVNPQNCDELISCSHIDGLFIGRSAWDVDGYLDILARCSVAIEKG